MFNKDIPSRLVDEFLDIPAANDQNNIINQMESDLSKYSINENDSELFMNQRSEVYNTPSVTPQHSYQDPSSATTFATTESISGSSDNLSLLGEHSHSHRHHHYHDHNHNDFNNNILVNQILLDNELNNGRIHGHIHNFENFTYIHGHIHTNDDNGFLNDSSNSKDSDLNDPDSLQFSECHHFEFLNCHDHSHSKDDVVLQDSSLVCQEDENCKPRIVEICCDNDHGLILDKNSNTERKNSSSTAPFIPNLPHCAELHCDTIHTSSSSSKLQEGRHHNNELFHNLEDEKLILDSCKVDSECIDIKCDLDTSCDVDELYCKLCDETDDDKSIFKQEPEQLNFENHSNSSTSVHSHLIHHNDYQSHHHHHHHKRSRDEDDEPLHHHLHHSHSNHSANHHHHHIQVHDHGNKKQKSEGVRITEINNDNNLINFEFNFKNKESTCEWDSCFTTLENSFQLQNHIFENHLLHQNANNCDGDIELLKNHKVQSKCEWKDCDFESLDLFQLVNHINSEHVNLVPPINHDSISEIQEHEETKCKWLDSENEQCGMKFETSKDLTDHLINHHIGAGKSQYVCKWADCSRDGKIFNQKQKIIRHLHVHTHYKPCKCPICNHSFAVESMLEQHMRTHSGEKPYSCKICGKKFATSSSLSIHVRIHTGEKPLVCKYPGCGKRFSESSNLTKHLKIHEKEFKCTYCSKSFSKEKQLVSHLAKYHS